MFNNYPKNKKFFKLPKPISDMSEDELKDFVRSIFLTIIEDDEDRNESR